MPDNKRIRHPLDGKRIDVNDPAEVKNWCRILNCSEAKLRHAVFTVGTSALAVKKYLDK